LGANSALRNTSIVVKTHKQSNHFPGRSMYVIFEN